MKINGLFIKIAAVALAAVVGAGAVVSLPRIARAETVTSTSQEVEALKTASVNSAEFNAYYYYITYPDLQAAFGANADLLYVHWTTVGKVEGRKGIDPSSSAAAAPSATATSTGTVALGTPTLPYKDVNGIRYIWNSGDPNKLSLSSATYVFDIAAMTAVENDPMLASYANEVRSRNDDFTVSALKFKKDQAVKLGISENLLIVVSLYNNSYNQSLPCFNFMKYYFNCPAVQRTYKPYETGAVYSHWVAKGSNTVNGLNYREF
ncbi:hypothetical protein [Butyrivibrio fibrisolvens]|uniref:Uncharacterized protein n=1 Tax=Butyrivibrio fibrisolvens TaxID=831 RepID=A0A317FYU9_BUTFI|nr:hypothetical protein [Butyrivibrio fibrisolvens]PWT26417.1 hypothetical protein CPT75_04410 [Butyrivibrio fibrisolvens]